MNVSPIKFGLIILLLLLIMYFDQGHQRDGNYGADDATPWIRGFFKYYIIFGFLVWLIYK